MRIPHWLRPLVTCLDRTKLTKVRRSSHRQAVRPHVESLEDRTVPSTMTWVGANGDWDVASNWNTGAVPGAADDVDINVSGITITHTAATAHSVHKLTLEAGTLTGSDDLTVNGSFVWTGGTLSGTGSVTAQGGMQIVGGVTEFLDGRTLVNAAGSTAAWVSPASSPNQARVVVSHGGTFVNQAGATFDAQIADLYGGNFGGQGTFVNAGLLERTTGTGDATFALAFQLTASGTVEVGTAGVGLGAPGAASSYSGRLTSAAGTRLQFFGGTQDFDPGSSIQAAGEVIFAGDNTDFSGTGTYTVRGSYSAASTELGYPGQNYGTADVSFTGPAGIRVGAMDIGPGSSAYLGCTLLEELGGVAQYGQIRDAGNLTLAGGLRVVLVNGFVPQPGTQFTIIDDQTSQPINGTFTNLPEGAALWDTTHTERFPITYVGGDGNNVILTGTAPLATVSVTDPSGTYNGVPFVASATVNGGSSLEGVTPTLTYYAGTYTLGTLPGSGGSSTAPTQAGSYTVVAFFAGSTDYASASDLDTFTIAQATPVFGAVGTIVIKDGTPSVTLTGTLSDGTLIPTGSVTVTLDSVSKTVAIGADGSFSATFATGGLSTGAHTLTFSYAGDTNFTCASATGSLDDTYGVLALFNQGKAKHAGSTLPVQIELTGAGGQNMSSAGVAVTALGIAATADTTDTVGATDPANVGTLTAVQAAGGSNPGNVFRFQGGSNPFYMYNLAIPTGLAAGTYRLYFSVAGDPLDHWVTFEVD